MKLSRRVMELAESATLAVSGKAARMKAQGIDVVGFGAGEPDFDTPAPICEATVAAIRAGQTRYPKPASGLVKTKHAICTRLKRVNQLDYAQDQVIVTSGGKDAAYLLIHALIDPGDEVIIPVPYWVSYPEIVRLAGGVPVFVCGSESDDFKLSPQLLESAITDRTRLFLFNSPSNPSGVTYHPDEVRALSNVLASYDVVVFSDEIYDQLLYDGQQTLSYAATSERAYDQTITANSASKTYAMPGFRLGYAAGPAPVIQAMAKLQSQSTSGAATFAQVALAAALEGTQDCIETMRREFERRAVHMHGRLTSMPGVRCARPTGAFYCFPNVSNTYEKLGVGGSSEFARRLLEEAHVAVVPGVAFGLDAHVRLSFASGMEQIDKGLDRIESFLR